MVLGGDGAVGQLVGVDHRGERFLYREAVVGDVGRPVVGFGEHADDDHGAGEIVSGGVGVVDFHGVGLQPGGGLGQAQGHAELRALDGLVRLVGGKAVFQVQGHHQVVERAERGHVGARAPHVQDGAALGGGAGAYGALVGYGGDQRHARQPVGTSLANGRYRPQDSGENLPRTLGLDARLHHIADPGNPHLLAGAHHVKGGGAHPGTLLRQGCEPFGVHLQHAGVIARLPAEPDLAHAIFCESEASHGKSRALLNPESVIPAQAGIQEG